MKSFVSILFALSLALLSTSCAKKDSLATTNDEPIVSERFITGKVLSKSASLCLLGRDFYMHPIVKLSAGKEILVVELDGIIDTKNVPDPNQVSNKTNQESEAPSLKYTEYVHVLYDNVDYWLEKSVFAMNCKTAVTIEKTFLYNDQDLTQKIESAQNPLRFATLIAKPIAETNTNNMVGENSLSGANKFAEKIFYYDTNSKSVKEAFVSSISISEKEDDIVVSQVVESLKVTTRAVPRNELFAKAAKYKPSAKVLAALNEQKVEKKSYNYQEVVNSLKTIRSGVNVNELLTVDQSKDPFR